MHGSLEGVVGHLMRSTFSDMENYLHMVTGALKREEDKRLERFDRETSSMSQEDKDRVLDFYLDDFHYVGNVFPQMLAQSLFLTIYAYIEHEIINLARHQEEELTHDETLPPRPNMDDAVGFWKRVGVDFPDHTREWREIMEYREIRNLIAHDNGWLSDDSDRCTRIKRYFAEREMADQSGASFEGINLVLTPDFCLEAIDTERAFLARFIKLLPWDD